MATPTTVTQDDDHITLGISSYLVNPTSMSPLKMHHSQYANNQKKSSEKRQQRILLLLRKRYRVAKTRSIHEERQETFAAARRWYGSDTVNKLYRQNGFLFLNYIYIFFSKRPPLFTFVLFQRLFSKITLSRFTHFFFHLYFYNYFCAIILYRFEWVGSIMVTSVFVFHPF